jgi:hypothetical protein
MGKLTSSFIDMKYSAGQLATGLLYNMVLPHGRSNIISLLY